jgi:hypothetical protein
MLTYIMLACAGMHVVWCVRVCIRCVFSCALQEISECFSFRPEHKAVSGLLSVVAEPFCGAVLQLQSTAAKIFCLADHR